MSDTTTNQPAVPTSLWQDIRSVLRDIFGMLTATASAGREAAETVEDSFKLAHNEVGMLQKEQAIRFDRIEAEQEAQRRLLAEA